MHDRMGLLICFFINIYVNTKKPKLLYFLYTLIHSTIVGPLCVDTSAPDGSLRTSRCDELNNYLCQIDANTEFCSWKGDFSRNYLTDLTSYACL